VVVSEWRFGLFYCMPRKNITIIKREKMDPEDYLVKLGMRIKSLRIAKGYPSYEKFAYAHDISRTQWGRYEKGQDLQFTSLVRVVNAFEMTLEEFFKEGF
jgi:hypothetical protein